MGKSIDRLILMIFLRIVRKIKNKLRKVKINQIQKKNKLKKIKQTDLEKEIQINKIKNN